jgi:uncharacterized protein (TIGR00297 family)
MSGFSESRRQSVHILAGTLALLLRWLTWPQAALLAAIAVLFNALALPRLAGRLFRPGDVDLPVRSGIVLYPLAVLVLVLCFPHRLDIVAVAWGILAAGDGAATLVGTQAPLAPLPWNRSKSFGGLLAFLVCGSAAGIGLAAWMSGTPGYQPTSGFFRIFAPIAAATAAGFVETLPIRLNDNISVPASAALLLWTLSAVDPAAFRANLPHVAVRLLPALAVNGVCATAAWWAGAVTRAGALAGVVIGVTTFAFAGLGAWVLLVAAFLASAIATRAGFRRKALLGIAEERGGRRGPGNAIANTSLAAWAAFVSSGMATPAPAQLAIVAALVTAASDTVASEVGKAWGRTTWLLVGLRSVAPGTSGAISREGTAAGIAAAALLAGLGVLLRLIPLAAVPAVVVAATVASLAESALGATLEGPGILDNHTLNFVNSALGAGVALLVWSMR